MPSKTNKKRRQQSLHNQNERKLSPKQKLTRSHKEKDLDTPNDSTIASPTSSPTSSKASPAEMTSKSSSPSASSTAGSSPLMSHKASTISISSEDSQGTPMPRESRKEQDWLAIRRKEIQKDFSAEEKDALDSFFRWDWATATARPPRPASPDLGPIDEEPGYDDPISTGFQGMQKEECRVLDAFKVEFDLGERDMQYFEKIYRDEKEMQLAGFPCLDGSPEEVLRKEIEEHRDAYRLEALQAELQAQKEREERERLEQKRAAKKAKEEEEERKQVKKRKEAIDKLAKKFGTWAKQSRDDDLPAESLLSPEEEGDLDRIIQGV